MSLMFVGYIMLQIFKPKIVINLNANCNFIKTIPTQPTGWEKEIREMHGMFVFLKAISTCCWRLRWRDA